MKKLTLTFVLVLTVLTCAHADVLVKTLPTIKNESNWTDLDNSFFASVKGNLVLMEGGNAIFNMYGFALRKQADGSYVVAKHPEDDGETNCPPFDRKRIGSVAKVQTFNNVNYLVFYDRNGKPWEVLKQHEDMIGDELANALYQMLEGRYNHPGGQQFMFAGRQCALGTNNKLQPYTFVDPEDNDMFQNIFKTADGQLYTWVESIQGIDLFKAHISTETFELEKDACVGQLEKVVGDVDNGRWPFTATQVVLPAMLKYYNKNILRVMRNEIYARHGWHFDNPYLREHFSAQWWYKDRNNNAGIRLSDLEQLNVDIIKAVEDRMED